MSNHIKNMGGYTLQQLSGYSFDEIKTLFETTMRSVNTFVPIESEVDRADPELAAGSSKRDAEEELDQESSKRQKTNESSELAEEPRDKEADELSQEEMQQMMIIVLEQGTSKYWKIIRVGNHTEVHHFFDDMLRAVDRDDLVMPWSLIKEKVHHVYTEEGIDIYMLVEKEYPLSRGTLTLMMVAKLLVNQDNEMSIELLRKIFMQEEMDLETAQTTTTAKFPILKQGEYDMWRLRIEQYFQVQDYALWDVIENGNSFKSVAQTTTNAEDYALWDVIENGNLFKLATQTTTCEGKKYVTNDTS
ncbi:hypothetical protein Tco_1434438 [Tanacetum coccineum]